MNIFATFGCPRKSAAYLDDKRVVKMVLESAQILSTVRYKWGYEPIYKPTHINHPCVKWAAEGILNHYWLFEHFVALCEEYTKRYKKIHKCQQYMDTFLTHLHPAVAISGTPFVNCTTFKHLTDVHEAYRLYLEDKWAKDKRKPTWYGSAYRNTGEQS